MSSYDAIIVGTRCAGASLAMLLARKGYKVLGIDRAAFPSDTISTHFLWPRTTQYLASWGLLDSLAATGCPRINLVTMHYGSVILRGRPEAVGGTASMYCPRRIILDELLVEAARAAGAEMRDRAMMRNLIWEGDRVVGVRVVRPNGEVYDERASIVVGADGLFSRVARMVNAGYAESHPSLTCGYYAYWQGLPIDGVEFYIGHGRDALVFPTHDNLTCIWAGRSHEQWEDYQLDVEAAYLATLDAELRDQVRAGKRTTPFRGTNKLPNFYRSAAGAGWALVGDAAYHRDPLTGMGIGDAFLGASLLAEAIGEELRGPSKALDRYAKAVKERTYSVFQYTLRAAALADPAPHLGLYTTIASSEAATRGFMNVIAGNAPYGTSFSPADVGGLTL